MVSTTLHEVCLFVVNAIILSYSILLVDKFLQYLNGIPVLLLVVFIFLIHELLHIIVIKRKGDISLTFKGIHFWLNTNAVLSKTRFLIFMSLPFLGLSVIPAISSLFFEGEIRNLLLIISWFNLIISTSDILNSFMIINKPRNSVFCRGYYRIKTD